MCVCITLCASVCSHRVFWLEVGVWAPGTLCFLHPFSACIFVCLLVHDLDEHLNKHKHTLQNNDATIKQPTYTIKYTQIIQHTQKTHYTQSAQYTQTMTLTHTCRCRSIHTQTTHTHTQKHSKTTHSHTNNSKQLTLTHNDTQKQHVTHKQWHKHTYTQWHTKNNTSHTNNDTHSHTNASADPFTHKQDNKNLHNDTQKYHVSSWYK